MIEKDDRVGWKPYVTKFNSFGLNISIDIYLLRYLHWCPRGSMVDHVSVNFDFWPQT